jgi:hypothetical protein
VEYLTGRPIYFVDEIVGLIDDPQTIVGCL